MAGQASVMVSFMAESADDAEAKVRGWTLSADCAVTISYTEQSPPLVTGDDGIITDAPLADSVVPPAELEGGDPATASG